MATEPTPHPCPSPSGLHSCLTVSPVRPGRPSVNEQHLPDTPTMKRNGSKARSGDRGDMNMVYTEMSGHYRRLLNAKAVVDTSPPRCYVPRRSPQRHASSGERRKSGRRSRIDGDNLTPSDLELIDQIIYDRRHSPGAFYRDSKRNIHWPPGHDLCRQERNSKQQSYKQQPYSKKQSTFKVPVYKSGKHVSVSPNRPPKAPQDIMDLHADSFESAEQNKPRILKTDANSRVRDLNVYHPPRRRSKKASLDSESPTRRSKKALVDSESPTRRSKKTCVDGQSSSRRLKKASVDSQSPPPRESVLICGPEVEWILNKALSNKAVEDPTAEKPFKECFCEDNPEPSSKMSIGSHDSAYVGSGGESRGVSPEQTLLSKSQSMGSAGESRGSTPEQEQTLAASQSTGSSRKSRDSTPEETLVKSQSLGSSGESKPVEKKAEVKSGGLFSCFGKSGTKEASATELGDEGSAERSVKEEPTDSLDSMQQRRMKMLRNDQEKDDFRYATFSHDITEDILLRGIFSDKGLNAVFKRHIQENEHLLEMGKMKKEVSLLRLQLGVPEQTPSTTSVTRTPSATSMTSKTHTPSATSVTSKPRTPSATSVTSKPRTPSATSVTSKPRTPSATSVTSKPPFITQSIPSDISVRSKTPFPSAASVAEHINQEQQDRISETKLRSVSQKLEELAEPSDELSEPTDELAKLSNESVQPNEELAEPAEELLEPSDESVQKTGLCCWGGGSKKKKPDETKKANVPKPLPVAEDRGKTVSDGSDEASTEKKENVYTVMPSLVNHSTRSMFQPRRSSSEHAKCETSDNSSSPQATDASKSNALSADDPSQRECNVPSSALVPDVAESLGYPCDPKVFDDQVLLYNMMSDNIKLPELRDSDEVRFADGQMSQQAGSSSKGVADEPSYETIVKSFAGWPYGNHLDDEASLILQEIESEVSSCLLSEVKTVPASTSTTGLRKVKERKNEDAVDASEPTELASEHQAGLKEESNILRTGESDKVIDENTSDFRDTNLIEEDQSEEKESDVREKMGDEVQETHVSTVSLESDTESISELPERIRRFTSEEIKLSLPHGFILPQNSFSATDLKKHTKEK